MKGKIALVLVLIGSGLAVGIGLLATRHPIEPDQAYQEMVCGHLDAASTALQAIEPDKLTLPYALYKGYLHEMAGEYDEARALFEALIQTPPNGTYRREVLIQSYLALANLAYQDHQDDVLVPLMQHVRHMHAGYPAVLFFDGLMHYAQAHYVDAYRIWNAYHPHAFLKERAWLMASMDGYYPLSWRSLHLAH